MKIIEGRKSIKQHKYEGNYGTKMNKLCKECGMPMSECLCEVKKVKHGLKETTPPGRKEYVFWGWNKTLPDWQNKKYQKEISIAASNQKEAKEKAQKKLGDKYAVQLARVEYVLEEGAMKRLFTDIQIYMEVKLQKGEPMEKVLNDTEQKFKISRKDAEHIAGTLDIEEYGVKGMKWGTAYMDPKKGIKGGLKTSRGSGLKTDANKKTAANWLDKFATRKFAKDDKEYGLSDEKDVKKIASLVRSGDFKKAAKKIDDLDTGAREQIPSNLRRWLKKRGAEFDWDYYEENKTNEQAGVLLDVGEEAIVSPENYEKLDSKIKSKIKPNEDLTVVSAFPGLADSVVLTNSKGDKVRISSTLLSRKNISETKKMKLSEVKKLIRKTIIETLDEASRSEIEKLVGKEAAMKYRKASTGEVKTYFGRFTKISGEGVYMGVLGKGLRKFLISNIISVSPAKFEAKQMAELDEMCKDESYATTSAWKKNFGPKK